MLPHWTWPGLERRVQGQPIDVRVYTNTDEVELLLNGQSPRPQGPSPATPTASDRALRPGRTGGARLPSRQARGQPDRRHHRPRRQHCRRHHTPHPAADGQDVAVLELTVRRPRPRAAAGRQPVALRGQRPAAPARHGQRHPGSHEADKPTERYRFTGFGPGPSATKRALDALPDPARHADPRAWRDLLPVGPRPRAPRPAPPRRHPHPLC